MSSIVQEVCSVLVEYLWTESISSNMPKSREDFGYGGIMAVSLLLGGIGWMPQS